MSKYEQEEVVNIQSFLANERFKVRRNQIRFKKEKIDKELGALIQNLNRLNSNLNFSNKELEKNSNDSVKALNKFKQFNWDFNFEVYSEVILKKKQVFVAFLEVIGLGDVQDEEKYGFVAVKNIINSFRPEVLSIRNQKIIENIAKKQRN